MSGTRGLTENTRKWILWGIPVLFLSGSLFHFLYALTGNFFPVGLIAPVNESVFEHMKLIPIPLILWWALYGLRNRKTVNLNAWLTAALLSLAVSLLSVPLLFYFYTGAFGIESLWIDIALLLVSIAIGQLLALWYYRRGAGIPARLALLLLIAVPVLFALFTLFPPRLPLFLDPVSGTYGIFAINS